MDKTEIIFNFVERVSRPLFNWRMGAGRVHRRWLRAGERDVPDAAAKAGAAVVAKAEAELAELVRSTAYELDAADPRMPAVLFNDIARVPAHGYVPLSYHQTLVRALINQGWHRPVRPDDVDNRSNS